ncbi:hypothetical protein CL615_02835 [archaeon]|jgi:hypothetical protein|nr:hypothetical protein [archaeon]MDP6547790.1 hypothetical protein [Candidatus Woesearchaeota archaeon]|tara:strand:- start:4632 stop:5096 length:465 start_codon:yes stop_codon:yes gene_type:complete
MFKKLEFSYEPNKSQNTLFKNKYFDLKMGSFGGLLFGGIVYYINSEHGVELASIAAAKQAGYAFAAAGGLMKICENVSTYFESGAVSRVMSVVVPSSITYSLTYMLHTLHESADSFESVIPTLIIAPISYTWWGLKNRKLLEDTIKELTDKSTK